MLRQKAELQHFQCGGLDAHHAVNKHFWKIQLPKKKLEHKYEKLNTNAAK